MLKEVQEKGVIFLDIDSGLREYPELFKKYFDTVIEIGQYKLGIKEKNILVVYDEDIDYFYSHYLNLIKK